MLVEVKSLNGSPILINLESIDLVIPTIYNDGGQSLLNGQKALQLYVHGVMWWFRDDVKTRKDLKLPLLAKADTQ